MYFLQKSKRRMPSKKEIALFRKQLLLWFKRNKRNYPWRETCNPFRILIAEMMLQRTKADQVLDVYNNFFSEFNSLKEVAHTDLKKLRKALYPIGLKWRVRNFKDVCISLIKNFNGKIPDTRSNLLLLPGVGEYVAGMVLSTAFGKNEWIIDTNVVRIFRRYFGIKTSKEGRRDRHVIEMAKIYSSGKNPRRANFAILDFTALICIPGKPNCKRCPFSRNCHYYKQPKQ